MNKKRICLLILLILVTIGACFTTYKFINRTPSVYYRTYTKEKGWSKWVKNGKTSGDGKHDITAIEIKVKAKEKGDVYYQTYYNGEWEEQVAGPNTSGNKNNGIIYVKAILSDVLYKKYDIEYRTYYDEWNMWNKNYGSILSNEDINIKQIQIRIIKK